jgi:hypothetical protein
VDKKDMSALLRSTAPGTQVICAFRMTRAKTHSIVTTIRVPGRRPVDLGIIVRVVTARLQCRIAHDGKQSVSQYAIGDARDN